MDYIKRHKAFIFIILLLILLFPEDGVCIEATEYQIKGAMIINFIKFVQWPDPLNDKNSDKITIGIIGKDNFGNTLEQIERKMIGKKQLSIRRINALNSLSDCQVLFVANSGLHRCYQILHEVSGMPVLTIGEDKDFIRLGGMIRFYNEKDHIRFEINRAAAEKSNLKLSAKLLEVAAAIH